MSEPQLPYSARFAGIITTADRSAAGLTDGKINNLLGRGVLIKPPRGRSVLLAWHLRGVMVGAPADLVAQPDQRVVLAADNPLL
jgi:hypothetical protein